MGTPQVNGRAVHFHDGGVAWQPERLAVVMIHGAGNDHTLWQQQSRALAHHGFNVMAVDLPGHGRSEDVPGIASIGDFADGIAELMEGAGLQRAALVGHSMGACIATELAGRNPERVTALVIVGAGLPMAVGDQLLHDTKEDQARAVDFITAFGHGRPAQLGHAPTPGNWLMGSSAAIIAATGPEVLHRDFLVCAGWDGAAPAARVRCPTLVVAGGEDRMTPPRAGRAFAEAIAGSRLEVLPGVGHFIPSEAPRPLLKLLRGFLDAAR